MYPTTLLRGRGFLEYAPLSACIPAAVLTKKEVAVQSTEHLRCFSEADAAGAAGAAAGAGVVPVYVMQISFFNTGELVETIEYIDFKSFANVGDWRCS